MRVSFSRVRIRAEQTATSDTGERKTQEKRVKTFSAQATAARNDEGDKNSKVWTEG